MLPPPFGQSLELVQASSPAIIVRSFLRGLGAPLPFMFYIRLFWFPPLIGAVFLVAVVAGCLAIADFRVDTVLPLGLCVTLTREDV